jgi:anionic cell wall polymer biosynthesis LytR-Cps2A-Psr (LCP) family protein
MSRRRITIIVAVVAGVLLLCACAVTIGYMAMNTPLGPKLQNSTQTPVPTQQITPGSTAATASVMPQKTSLPSTAIPSNCGEKGSMNILVLGVDSPFADGFKGPLAIRLVKVDFNNKSANVFSFPRDLWIPITGLESYGFTQARLGELYLIARGNAGLSDAAATNLVAQNLYQNFGAWSDHYIDGKMSTLAAIIDTVGGLTLNIPAAYDGTPYGMHYFPAGLSHLNGLLALEYAVSPTAFGQWNGLDRQTLVLYALFQRILSADMLPKLPTLIPQFLQVAVTDLSVQQILNLVCISQQIPKDRIVFTGIGPSEVTLGASGVLYPVTDAIRAKVQQYLTPNTP